MHTLTWASKRPSRLRCARVGQREFLERFRRVLVGPLHPGVASSGRSSSVSPATHPCLVPAVPCCLALIIAVLRRTSMPHNLAVPRNLAAKGTQIRGTAEYAE